METPQNTNKAVLESLVDSAIEESQVQPDWDQNDPEARDYIKNRVGYYNYELHDNFFDEGDLTQGVPVEFDETPIIPEQSYKIIYGDQEYELTCRSSNQYSNNFYIIGRNFGSETGFDYPFQFYVSSYTNSKQLNIVIYGNIPDPKILKIEGLSWKKNVQIKKIPDECINFYQSDWNENSTSEKSYIQNKPKIYTPNLKTSPMDTDLSDGTRRFYFPNFYVYKIEVFSSHSAKTSVARMVSGTEQILTDNIFTVDKNTVGLLFDDITLTETKRRYTTYTFPPFSGGFYINELPNFNFSNPNQNNRAYIKLSLSEELSTSEQWTTLVNFYYFE